MNLVPEFKSEEANSNKIWIMIAFVIIALAGISFYFVRRPKTTEPFENTEIEPIESISDSEVDSDIHLMILNCKKSTLTSDELDEILGINHLEADSKKLKRHRILNEFEKNYPNVITRVKDQNDKRRFIYKLNSHKT